MVRNNRIRARPECVGVMAAVVSGHYGAAGSTGRRALRGGGRYGAATTTGRTKGKRPAPSGRTLCAHGERGTALLLIVPGPALWAHDMLPDGGTGRRDGIDAGAGARAGLPRVGESLAGTVICFGFRLTGRDSLEIGPGCQGSGRHTGWESEAYPSTTARQRGGPPPL